MIFLLLLYDMDRHTEEYYYYYYYYLKTVKITVGHARKTTN